MKRPTKRIKINLTVEPPKFTISEKKDARPELLKNIPLSPGIKKILKIREVLSPQFHGFFKPELMKPVEWCEDIEEYERREQKAIEDATIGWSKYKYDLEWSEPFHEWNLDPEKAKVLERSCWNCGTVFETSDKRKKYCCQECAWKDLERWRKIKRSERLLSKPSLSDNKYTGIVLSKLRDCPICQEKYYPKTIRSITCGKGNCRTAWSRQQKNNKN